MKFGFDIDDTLINLREHAFHIYNKKLNQNVDVARFHALRRVEIHELFGMTDEEGSKMWNSLLDEIYYTSCPPYPHAIETLKQLESDGHEIYYITARPKEHGKRTMEWMIAQGFPVHPDRFFYGMNDEAKVDIVKDLALDFYFDDKPAVLNTLQGLEVRAFAKTQPYNVHLNTLRIDQWSELSDLLLTEKN